MTDERKNVFIETVDALFKSANTDIFIPIEAIEFFEDYKKGKSSNRKEITGKGIAIILAMRENPDDWVTAKALGEVMDVSGRSVSGSMKKLVEDGYVEKRAGTPSAYKITEKGLTCDLPTAEVDNE